MKGMKERRKGKGKGKKKEKYCIPMAARCGDRSMERAARPGEGEVTRGGRRR